MGVEPAHFICGPDVGTAKRRVAIEPEEGALRRAFDREEQAGIVTLRIVRLVPEGRRVEVARGCHDKRRICAPSIESFSSMRS